MSQYPAKKILFSKNKRKIQNIYQNWSLRIVQYVIEKCKILHLII